ncbi:MAG: hypothetical protein ACRCUS_08930 [Anaerovoracaceae bacterium]
MGNINIEVANKCIECRQASIDFHECRINISDEMYVKPLRTIALRCELLNCECRFRFNEEGLSSLSDFVFQKCKLKQINSNLGTVDSRASKANEYKTTTDGQYSLSTKTAESVIPYNLEQDSSTLSEAQKRGLSESFLKL